MMRVYYKYICPASLKFEPLSAYFLQSLVQFLHLLVGSDRDPEMIVDPLLIPVPDIDTILFQPFKNLPRRYILMADKDEIAIRLRKRETQPMQLFLRTLSGADYSGTAFLKICHILHRRQAKLERRIIHRIRIYRVLHIIQIFDQPR